MGTWICSGVAPHRAAPVNAGSLGQDAGELALQKCFQVFAFLGSLPSALEQVLRDVAEDHRARLESLERSEPEKAVSGTHVQQYVALMEIRMTHPAAAGEVSLIGNPIKYSETAADYRRPPPLLGEHTDDVLAELLDLGSAEIAALRDKGII